MNKEEKFLKQISLIMDVPLALMHSETQEAIKETYRQYAEQEAINFVKDVYVPRGDKDIVIEKYRFWKSKQEEQ